MLVACCWVHYLLVPFAFMFSCHSWTGCLAFVFSRTSFVSFSRSLATRWRTHALALLLPRTLSPSLVGVCGPACLYGLSIGLFFLFCPLSAVSLHGCTRNVDTLFWFPRSPPPLSCCPALQLCGCGWPTGVGGSTPSGRCGVVVLCLGLLCLLVLCVLVGWA